MSAALGPCFAGCTPSGSISCSCWINVGCRLPSEAMAVGMHQRFGSHNRLCQVLCDVMLLGSFTCQNVLAMLPDIQAYPILTLTSSYTRLTLPAASSSDMVGKINWLPDRPWVLLQICEILRATCYTRSAENASAVASSMQPARKELQLLLVALPQSCQQVRLQITRVQQQELGVLPSSLLELWHGLPAHGLGDVAVA